MGARLAGARVGARVAAGLGVLVGVGLGRNATLPPASGRGVSARLAIMAMGASWDKTRTESAAIEPREAPNVTAARAKPITLAVNLLRRINVPCRATT